MISNQILQSNVEGLKEITRIDLCVCDVEGKVLASTFEGAEEYESSVLAFADSPAESQLISGYQFFKVFDEHQLEYILLAKGASDDVYMVGKLAAFQIQNLLVIVLVFSLGIFAVFGMPSVDLATYFSNADGMFLTDGIPGFLTATAYLGFATGGATIILGVSAECKNPTKDIPFVIIVSTCAVAVLYGFVATVASGVLPTEQVMNQPLTLVAQQILPTPLYILFIVGGAMFALATTLNSQIMSCTKPVMQSCEDGWFPTSLATLSKFKTPYKILIIYYFILVVPILLDLEIAQISSIVQILGYINNLIFTITAMKLPKMFPEAWEKSAFHVPTPVFNALMIVTCIAIVIQASFMLSSMTPTLIIFNVVVMAVGFIWAFYRTGSGKAKPTVSYEMA